MRKWLLTSTTKQGKHETSLDKLRVVVLPRRLKSTERPGRGSPQDVADTSLVRFLSGSQRRRDSTHFPHGKPLRASFRRSSQKRRPIRGSFSKADGLSSLVLERNGYPAQSYYELSERSALLDMKWPA